MYSQVVFKNCVLRLKYALILIQKLKNFAFPILKIKKIEVKISIIEKKQNEDNGAKNISFQSSYSNREGDDLARKALKILGLILVIGALGGSMIMAYTVFTLGGAMVFPAYIQTESGMVSASTTIQAGNYSNLQFVGVRIVIDKGSSCEYLLDDGIWNLTLNSIPSPPIGSPPGYMFSPLGTMTIYIRNPMGSPEAYGYVIISNTVFPNVISFLVPLITIILFGLVGVIGVVFLFLYRPKI